MSTDRLGKIGPWLPVRPAIRPDQEGAAKFSRAKCAGQPEEEFVRLFVEEQRDWDLPESIVP